MYDEYNNDHLQYVSISGQAPDIQLTLLDCSGKAETFTISEMLFYGYKKEEDRSKQERECGSPADCGRYKGDRPYGSATCAAAR